MREVKDESLYSANYFEYSILKNKDIKTSLLKFAIILGAVLILVLYVVVFDILLNNMTLYFVPLLILLLVILCFVFWKYTSVEFEYEIVSGKFTMRVIYSGRKSVTLFSTKISKMEYLASYQGEFKNKVDAESFKHVYKCVSSMEHPQIYYAIFKNESDDKCVVFFQAPKKVISILKFYNSTATLDLKYIQG